MKQCNRCGRNHTGVCGIPSTGIRIGMGVRNVAKHSRTGTREGWHIEGKPPRPRKATHSSLQQLLNWGLEEERKCLEILKALPPELEEYDILLGKFDKLKQANQQIREQLAQRV